MTRQNGFRIATWPAPAAEKRSDFHYPELFHAALRDAGVESRPLSFSEDWLGRHASEFDAIHLHWVEYRWGRADSFLWSRLRQIAALRSYLRLARARGLHRILTLHNLEPHESPDGIDRLGFRVAIRNSDLIVCHAAHVAEMVRERYRPRGRIAVMYHGSFEGVFPAARDRTVVRSELGVPAGRPLLACLGAIGEYKGLDVACNAASRLRDRVALLIAGRPRPGYDTRALRERVRQIAGARFIDRNLTAEEFADFATASEAWLLPYKRTAGSGALLAAWSLGRGVVASDLPYFRELVGTERDSGELFAPGDPGALADAVERYIAVPFERRERAALSQRARYSWSRCVAPIVDILEEWRRA